MSKLTQIKRGVAESESTKYTVELVVTHRFDSWFDMEKWIALADLEQLHQNTKPIADKIDDTRENLPSKDLPLVFAETSPRGSVGGMGRCSRLLHLHRK